jgi:hypothetical protein
VIWSKWTDFCTVRTRPALEASRAYPPCHLVTNRSGTMTPLFYHPVRGIFSSRRDWRQDNDTLGWDLLDVGYLADGQGSNSRLERTKRLTIL